MTQISDQETGEIYAFAIQLAKDAGALLMDRATDRMQGGHSDLPAEEKENAVDIVTKADEGT